jgi:crossover junction endodeoxyribonuclease RusA
MRSDARKRLAQQPATVIVLDPPCAFINANDRLHHHAKAKLTKAWRDMAHDHAAYHADHGVTYDRAHITVAIRFPDNIRRDVGNWFPTAKACLDGIVQAGLLEDDDDTRVLGPDMRRTRPNGTPQVTITIQEQP